MMSTCSNVNQKEDETVIERRLRCLIGSLINMLRIPLPSGRGGEASFLVNSYYSMNVIKHRIFSHDNYNLQVPVVSN